MFVVSNSNNSVHTQYITTSQTKEYCYHFNMYVEVLFKYIPKVQVAYARVTRPLIGMCPVQTEGLAMPDYACSLNNLEESEQEVALRV